MFFWNNSLFQNISKFFESFQDLKNFKVFWIYFKNSKYLKYFWNNAFFKIFQKEHGQSVRIVLMPRCSELGLTAQLAGPSGQHFFFKDAPPRFGPYWRLNKSNILEYISVFQKFKNDSKIFWINELISNNFELLCYFAIIQKLSKYFEYLK